MVDLVSIRFEEVYSKFHLALYANIIKLVKDPMVAEDILQEVFITFWEKGQKLDDERLPGWLFTISFNKSITKIRKELIHKSLEISKDIETLSSDNLQMDEEENFVERWQLVDEASNLLSPARKRVFIMSRFEGKNSKQIAEALEISVEAVYDYRKQAMKTIRNFIKEKKAVDANSISLSILCLQFLAYVN